MNDLIIKLATGDLPSDRDLELALYEICDSVHAGCDDGCPVYRLNGSEVPDTAKDFEINRGCDCFKDGKAMLEFIRTATAKEKAMQDGLESMIYKIS